MRAKKQVKPILIPLILILSLLCGVLLPAGTAFAFTDPGIISDADFFGVWNSGSSSWTTVGKIDYSYSASLNATENYVKAGDYASAKTSLLSYFSNRTSKNVFEYDLTNDRNTDYADLICDDIFSITTETYVTKFTVGNSFQTVSTNVSDAVEQAMLGTGEISFMLMSREKDAKSAQIYSREQASNKPTLEVVISGQTYQVTASEDVHIRAGTYEDDNYETAASLYVKDDGVPFNDNNRRAYIRFDLSSLSGTPTSASLKLYGRNNIGTGDTDIMVFTTGMAWDEDTLTWATATSGTFSWQGEADSADWDNPGSGADTKFDEMLTRFDFMQEVVAEYLNTSDNDYASKIIEIMLDLLEDKGANAVGYANALQASIRAKNWITGYHYLVDSTPMDSDTNAAILKFLYASGDYLYDSDNFDSDTNFGLNETTGLYQLSLYFPEFTDSDDWLVEAYDRFDTLSRTLEYNDGAYIEATSMYAAGNCGGLYGAVDFGTMNGETIDDFGRTFNLGIQTRARYTMDFCLPDGMDPQYGDSDYLDESTKVYPIADEYNNQELLYFGSGGSEGTAPSYTSVYYPEGLDAIMRTGWEAMTFICI